MNSFHSLHIKFNLLKPFTLTAFIMLAFSGAVSAQCPHPDFDALMALYNSTNGPSWVNDSGWSDGAAGTSCDPCQDNWHGVTCNNGRVTSLYLVFNNLDGHLPPEIGNLTNLEYLDLPGNQITAIPPEIGNLENLIEIYLSANQITAIPPETGSLNNLLYILLTNNQLTAIPPEIGNLENLGILDLSNNMITSIPVELGNLVNLATLNLVNNQVSCIPNALSALCGFTNVDVSNNLNNIDWPSFCNDGTGACCTQPDFDALLALYDATNGPGWTTNTGWEDGAAGISCDPCQDNWFGVTCDNGRVSQLNLENNQLNGNLPVEMGQLTNLEILNLGLNQISSVPAEIGNLNNLANFHLNNNQISSIPAEIGDLINLNSLDLGNNQITSIPPEMGSLNNLAYLNLNMNMVSSIPPEIGNLLALNQLIFAGNQIDIIPPEIVNLVNLGVLDLSNNQIHLIPPEIVDLVNLNDLYLNNNQITCIPTELSALCGVTNVDVSNNLNNLDWAAFCVDGTGDCCTNPDYVALMALYQNTDGPNWKNNTGWVDGASGTSCDPCLDSWYGVYCTNDRVTHISMEENRISGNIPAEIGNLTNLVRLNLSNTSPLGSSNNQITSIPPEIGNLNHLERLELNVNEVATIPPEIGNLSNLTFLRLSLNEIDFIPPEIGNLTNLHELLLDGNQINTIPFEIANLTNMYTFKIGNNEINTIPAIIGTLPNLSHLGLHGNQIDIIPPEIGNLSNLAVLALDQNQIDFIPPEIGNLTNLGMLTLSNNQISVIPPVIGNLTKLTWLSLDGNQLSAIPSEIENLTDLWRLSLVNNQITSIPPEIGNLGNLRYLYLYINQITSIPPEIGNLSNLDHLYLNRNQITSIPPEIGNLGNLRRLYLDNNQIDSIPPEIGYLINLERLYLDNNQIPCFPPELSALCGNTDVNLSSNLNNIDWASFCSDGTGTCDPCANDADPPSISCPDDMAVNVDANCQFEISSYTNDVTVEDECTDTPVITQSPAHESFVGLGSTPITMTAADDLGNSASCSFTLTVLDGTDPSLTDCPVDLTVDNDPGKCSATVTWPEPNAADNCNVENVILSSSPTTGLMRGSMFPVGQTAMTYIATDDAGNTASCAFSVTVNDNEDPIIACPTDITRYFDYGQNDAIVSYLVGASDNCPGAVLAQSAGLGSGSVFPLGTTTEAYTLSDAAGNSVACSFDVIITKRPASIDYAGVNSAQYSDEAVVSATLTDGLNSIPIVGEELLFSIGSQSVTATTNVSGIATASIIIDQAPGTYQVQVDFVENAQYQGASASESFTILQEDAVVTYTGSNYVSTSSSNHSEATVFLTATIEDINDANRGEIMNATVYFIDAETGIPINSTPLAISLISPTVGTVSFAWDVDINNADAEQFEIAIRVGNYYLRDNPEDNTIILVTKPVPNKFITGGGYFTLCCSEGTLAGEEGTKTNFGFNVKFNNSGTNLKGKIRTLFRRIGSDGLMHTYRVKGNKMTSLVVEEGYAEFFGKANVQDVTDPNNPVSVLGNGDFIVKMNDFGEPGAWLDNVVFSLYDNDGVLIYTSNWDGTEPVLQLIEGGNIKVHDTSPNNALTIPGEIEKTPAYESRPDIGLEAWPNPAKDLITLDISGMENGPLEIVVRDLTGKEVMKLEHEYVQGDRIGLDLKPEMTSGLYYLTLKNSNYRKTIPFVKF